MMTVTTAHNWILHLTTRLDWQAAIEFGEYRAPSLVTEGFIHCSTQSQMISVANHFYQGVPDLILLWLEPQKIVAELRWDPVGEQVFPHIYGSINLDAVEKVSDFSPDPDGLFRRLPGL